MYLPSPRVIAIGIRHVPDRRFQGCEILNVNTSKKVRASKNMINYDFYRGWYSPSNGTVVDVVLLTLFLILGQTFSCYAGSGCSRLIFLELQGPAVDLPLFLLF